MQQNKPTKCGFISVVGAPNVGKSSLINRILGTKVSIVTPKKQTTRFKIRGIYVDKKLNCQMIFIDTPGIFQPKQHRLEKAMVKTAVESIKDTDAVVFLTAPKYGVDADLVRMFKDAGIRPLVVINQVDAAPKIKTAQLAEDLKKTGLCDSVLRVSAKTAQGVPELLAHLAAILPTGPFLFDEDQLSDQSSRAFCAEITREKLFLFLRDELPYSLTVETEEWQENPDESVRIHQIIITERDAHKKIILGAKGTQIKKIGMAARLEMEKELGVKIHLFLRVIVKENWINDPERYRNMGLEF